MPLNPTLSFAIAPDDTRHAGPVSFATGRGRIGAVNTQSAERAAPPSVGVPTPLIDGEARVRGRLRFTADYIDHLTLAMRLVTSPYAHARVRSIDTEAACGVPGVVRVLTAADLPAVKPTNRVRLLLARERVLFAGHPVALVVADSEAAAEDGVDAVLVDYEPLPAVTTIDAAARPDAPLVWPEGVPGEDKEAADHGADVGGAAAEPAAPSNVANPVGFQRGDAGAALRSAYRSVDLTFEIDRVHQSYLEPHATIAAPGEERGATVWSASQAPSNVQKESAALLGVPAADVDAKVMNVGGGFGGKFILYEPLVAAAALAVGAPVYLVMTRREELLAAQPAAGGRIRIRLGADADGALTAIKADLTYDGGCFPGSPTGIGAMMCGSIYRASNIDVRGHTVMTHKPSIGAYRAPGMTQQAFALESAMDELAIALGMDALELRLRNVSQAGDALADGSEWPDMGMREVLEKLRAHPLWQQRGRLAAEGRGVGVALGAWFGGVDASNAGCTVEEDGGITVHLNAVDLTGVSTSVVLLVAEEIGVSPDDVRVRWQGQVDGPYHLSNAGGSKTLRSVGPAVMEAARDAREQLFRVAATHLEADAGDLEIAGGAVRVKGVPESAVPIGELAAKRALHGPIAGHGRSAPGGRTPAFCGQMAEVSVDEETGRITVHRIVVAQDVGRAINPLTVAGQMMGGAAQGAGWALCERLVYDEDGQLLTGTLMDYAVPSAKDIPPIEALLVERPAGYAPHGARGVGEPPIIATAGAIANAVRHGSGRRVTSAPLTPSRVLETAASA